MLFHLIYVSTAVAAFSDLALANLLEQSRARNLRHGLTGLLLYKNGHFMQVLEGEESHVMEVFASIERDARHKSVDVLRTEYIQYRDFPDWSMGFRNVGNLDPSSLPGFTRFLEEDFTAEYFSADAVEAHRLLLAFKESP